MLDDSSSTLTEVPERFSRRRLLVFFGSLFFAGLVSLTYVYMRPAEYRAVALLQISPPETVAESNDDTKSPDLRGDPKSFLTEVQVLTSRPLLTEAVRRLKAAGKLPDLGKDPVDAVQKALHAAPVADTQVVELAAVSTRQVLVSDLVNMVAAVYREQLARFYNDRVASTNADVSDDARRLHEQVVAKRKAVEAYRDRYDIVSLDRNENEVLANIDGLNRAYADGNAAVAKAQGRLEAVRSALAAGKPIARTEDSAALATLETELNTLQEKKRALDRRYSSAYQVLDEDTKTLPAQIADLEQQIQARRATSGRAALAEAESNLAGAREAVAQLRKDVDDNQGEARSFAGRLAAFKVMQEDLDHLQAMERAVNDRSAKLQSSVRERAPRIRLVQAGAPAFTPWRPNYTRDALIAGAGSVLFALFVTWLAEYLHGPAPASTVLVHHSLALPSLGRFAEPALRALGGPLRGASLPDASGRASLPAPEPAVRELENAELAALLANPSADLRLAVAALLSGLDAAEIVALRWDQVDPANATIALGGASARTIRPAGALAALLAQRPRGAADAPVFHNERGDVLTAEELDRLILFGAYDAGLDRPQEITAATLRRSYIAFLLRQGIRAADIGRVAGHIPQDEMVAYMQRTPPRTRLPLEQVDCLHPALGSFAGGNA